MKTVLSFLAALVLVAISAQPSLAQTRTVRHPATGLPAIVVQLPADWSEQVDDSGNLIIASANRSVAYSITVAEEARAADVIAREALSLAGGQDITPQGAGAITPYSGSLFTGTLPMSGMALGLRCIVVKPDPEHFVSVTLVTNPSATNASKGEAALVLSNMRVVQ